MSTLSSSAASTIAIASSTTWQQSIFTHCQSVLHAAARLVVQRRMYDHITADIRGYLHWLPVNYRIDFKLCALMYKCLHRTAPLYLSDLSDMCTLMSTNPTRSQLRSASSGDLIVPRIRTVTYGPHSFSFSGPTTWNALPTDIHDPLLTLKQFSTKLKL